MRLAALDVVARGERAEVAEQAGPAEMPLGGAPARRGGDGERQAAFAEEGEQLDGARLDRHAGLEQPGGVAIDVPVEVVEPEGRPEELLDHAVAFRARACRSSNGRSESGISTPMIAAPAMIGLDVDGLGVDQQAIHVENDGLDGFIEHDFVLSCRPETANIGRSGGRKIHAHP